MTLLTWPSAIEPAEGQDYWISHRQALYASPATGSEALQELPGARWRARLPFEDLERDEWRDLEGLLANLGRAGGDTVALPDHAWPGNRGTPGTSVLATAAAESRLVSMTGLAGPLLRGDRFMLGPHLYVVRYQATPVSGAATVGVAPRLRAAVSGVAVAFGTAPLFRDLTCPMRLLDGEQGRGSRKSGPRADFVAEFVEPLPFVA